jgi:hypothetical protein
MNGTFGQFKQESSEFSTNFALIGDAIFDKIGHGGFREPVVRHPLVYKGIQSYFIIDLVIYTSG